MSQFNYEQSVWGNGSATLRATSPTSIRLRHALRAIRTVPPAGAVAEIGCGVGQFIRTIKIIRPDLVCHGSDISMAAIAKANEYQDGVVYSLSAIERLPYDDSSMDAVLIFDVLEHVQDPLGLLTEVCRVLKPGGKMYAFVPCEGDWLSGWLWLDKLGLKKGLTNRFAGHINYFSRSSLKKLCVRAGFVVVTERYSEHVLGQLIGIAAFWLMSRAAKKYPGVQINNEAYFSLWRQEANRPRVMRLVGGVVNFLVYFESLLLSRLPSPNVHLSLVKPSL